MNEWTQFEALAARAREETGPRLDVTAHVLKDIRLGSAAVSRSDLPLWILSGVSLAAASAVVMLAIQSWDSWANPLSGLFDTLTMVMQ